MTLANGLVLDGEWNWIRIKYFGRLMHDYVVRDDLVFLLGI